MLKNLYLVTGTLLVLFALATAFFFVAAYFRLLILEDLSRVPFYVIFLVPGDIMIKILSAPFRLSTYSTNSMTALYSFVGILLSILFFLFLGYQFLLKGYRHLTSRSLTIAASLSLLTIFAESLIAINLFLVPCREFCGVGVFLYGALGFVPVFVAFLMVVSRIGRGSFTSTELHQQS